MGQPDQYSELKQRGIALFLQRRLPEAAAALAEAAAVQPDDQDVLHLLSSVHGMLGDIQSADDYCRRLIALNPEHETARLNLGNVLVHQGRYDEAAEQYRQVVAVNPRSAQAYNNLGVVLKERQQLDEAQRCLQQALQLDPSLCDAHINLANVQVMTGEPEAGLHELQRALELDAGSPAAHTNLAGVLRVLGRYDEAEAALQASLRLAPDLAETHNAMAQVLIDQGRLDEALREVRRALQLKPLLAYAHNNMGIIYTRQGHHEQALACFREALRLQPLDAVVRSNLLFLLCYSSQCDAATLFQEHVRWGQLHGVEPAAVAPHANVPDPDRRVRIGYVSPDFHHHPVGCFIEQVLAHHDKAGFEVVCYYNRVLEDDLTLRLQALADQWHVVAGMSDAALAQRIRGDGIDILVDLAGHTAGNRLLTFALKPAPVQATWMSYVATTGLRAIDYIIANRYVIPPQDERLYVERVVRLPHSFLCFTPPDAPVEVGPLPCAAGAGVVFGCFNNAAKLTDDTVAVWARILTALPDARLFLKAEAFGDEPARADFVARLGAHGVAAERVRFAGWSPHNDYLAAYNEVDIGLDPFPYNGGTTTVEALWMGVPVVTLRGDRFVGRMGDSILSNLGLPELVNDDRDGYVATAVGLAGDPARLAELRRTLRARLVASPLCDGPGFTRDLEAVYRGMWRAWCAGAAG